MSTVVALRRYPVKSMLGEELASARVSQDGLDRDRRLALVNTETGKVASAKNPRLWRGMLAMTATAAKASVRIKLADGTVTWSTAPDVDEVLSAALGQPVTLADTPPPGATLDRSVPEEVLRAGVTAEVPARQVTLRGSFFDFAPVHLVTTATLDAIARRSTRQEVEALRYRPNIVISTDAEGFAENDWLGRELRIGDSLVLRVIARTGRCAIPTLEHGDLGRDTDALRVPAAHNRLAPMADAVPQPCVGVYAQVIAGGQLRCGDQVEPSSLPGAGGPLTPSNRLRPHRRRVP